MAAFQATSRPGAGLEEITSRATGRNVLVHWLKRVPEENLLAPGKFLENINVYMISQSTPASREASDTGKPNSVRVKRFPCVRLAGEPADRAEVEVAFREVPAVALEQAWLAEPDRHFRPGSARFAYTEEALLVLAEFEDDDVFNPVFGFNQPAYEFGDVCEVFWLPEGVTQYAEIHLTPEGSVWQAVFPLGWMEKKRKGLLPASSIKDLNVSTPQPRTRTWTTERGWAAFYAIPFSLLGTSSAAGKIAVCRYDYTQGLDRPVLSSTASFLRCDFHLLEYWSLLEPA
jgi:hypothetical protein